MKTRRTVPGQMVIRVLRTNLVLKLILLRAPILLELASVKSLLWSNITRQIKYNLDTVRIIIVKSQISLEEKHSQGFLIT